MKFKTFLAVVGVLVIMAVSSSALYVLLSTPPRAVISIGGSSLNAEVADEPEERSLGLSNRDNLAEDSAMLFVFESAGTHGIWMKDTRFDLDIIWLDGDKQVVDIVEGAKPSSYPYIFKPSSAARYVVEANAGFVRANGVEVGQQAEF